MKGMRIVVATLAVFAAMSSAARASLILVDADGNPSATVVGSFVDLGGQGFGSAPRMLTLQTNTVESGFETPVDVENGDAIDGANKSTTPLLSALGWTTGANVGIGFNSGQTGNSGITMQDLVLTIYNAANAAVGSFALGPALIQFTEADLGLQQGNGNAVFAFGLDAAQRTAFNTLIAGGITGWRAGLGSTLGCPAGSPVSCAPSNDGPDSFLGFNLQGENVVPAVPEPGSLLLLGTGLFGSVAALRRRSRKAAN